MIEVKGETPADESGGVDCDATSSLHRRRAEEAAPEVTWTWKRKSLQGTVATVNLYYQNNVFEDIRSVLTAVGGKELLKQFSDGCFGHLMQFIGGPKCIKALHELISREIDLPGAREDELWFHISGTNIRFSPSEYALVTGLRFGSSSFDPLGTHEIPVDGVYMQLCSGCPISISELWNRFKSQDGLGSMDGYLKVAHILALYAMVLGYDQRRTVYKWLWVLVEDLELWNRFPWGAFTYRELMHYTSILPRTRAALGSRYHFYGPVWALQIWAYEAIPQLGNTCALITGKVTVPRCLKWSFRGFRPWKRIDFAKIFEQELVCFTELEPTDEEKLQPYWESVQAPQPLGVQYTPHRRSVGTGSRARAPLSSEDSMSSQDPCPSAEHTSPDEVSDSDDSAVTSSARLKRAWASMPSSLSSGDKKGIPHHIAQVFDEAGFVDQVADRVVDRLIEPMVEHLSQQLIPQMKQLLEDLSRRSRQSPSQPSPPKPSREVHDQLEMMQDASLLHAKTHCVETAKAAERKKEQSYDGRSSSMNFSTKVGNGLSLGEKKKPAPKDAFGGVLNNAPSVSRFDAGVSGAAKSFEDRKTAIDQYRINSNEPSKSELKASITKKKKKKSRQFSSSSEETSDDEGSESSSGEERRRRRKRKKRCRKKWAKYSDSSSSESDRRHRRRRKRHERRRSSSSDSDAGDSK